MYISQVTKFHQHESCSAVFSFKYGWHGMNNVPLMTSSFWYVYSWYAPEKGASRLKPPLFHMPFRTKICCHPCTFIFPVIREEPEFFFFDSAEPRLKIGGGLISSLTSPFGKFFFCSIHSYYSTYSRYRKHAVVIGEFDQRISLRHHSPLFQAFRLYSVSKILASLTKAKVQR